MPQRSAFHRPRVRSAKSPGHEKYAQVRGAVTRFYAASHPITAGQGINRENTRRSEVLCTKITVAPILTCGNDVFQW